MNTHDKYELPPLPDCSLYISGQPGLCMINIDHMYELLTDYARAAIEADRKRHDRMLAHEWIRPALDLPENAPYRFDYYAQEIERLRNDRKRRGEPVAWVAADTLNSPHPGCVSSLAYMSQLDKDRGREYVPLYAAPVAAQAPAASAETKKAVTVSQLEMLFESEDVDRQQPGYHWRKGWNAAIRRCMDIAYPMYAAPVAAQKADELAECRSAVADEVLALLERSLAVIQHDIDEIGGCDHSVGICCCELIHLADDIRAAMQRTSGGDHE